jgi:hypothetical protein
MEMGGVEKHRICLLLLVKIEDLSFACLSGLVSLGLAFLGLWDKDRVDVWKNTTLGNGDTTEKLVQLLIIADSQQDVARDNAGLLVVAGSVASKFKNFSSEVFKDGSKIDWSTSTNARSVLAFLQEATDSSDWELKTSLGRLGLGLLALGLSTTTLSSLSALGRDGRSSNLSSTHFGIV